MFCNAPWNNMYVQISGNVSPCWKTLGQCDKWSKDRSLMDIWKGKNFDQYRESIKNDVAIHRCQECKSDIENDIWPLAKAYENFPVNPMPSLMEIELSNQCNLECIMCNGLLSSGIRKNREKKPPLPQLFDETFNEQMKDFIPHLTELRVNGGEPFAQKILLDLLDIISEIKPDLKVNIATNGTVYNKRVQKILDNCNIHLNISIDSLKSKRYEQIRVNGKFDILMKNFEIFKKYCHNNNRDLSIMVNPMSINWDEMVEFVKFTQVHRTNLWYNTVLYPHHLTIRNLPAEKIKIILDNLKNELLLVKRFRNYEKAKHLVYNQIQNWYLDAISEMDIPKFNEQGALMQDEEPPKQF